MATSDLKIEMKKEKIREEEISLDSDEIPLEVRRSIEQLKKDKNVEEISLSIIEYKENQVRNSKMATQLNGWGNPYKGYKNLYYKDWIIKSSSSSNWVLIRENTWGNLKGVKI